MVRRNRKCQTRRTAYGIMKSIENRFSREINVSISHVGDLTSLRKNLANGMQSNRAVFSFFQRMKSNCKSLKNKNDTIFHQN